MNSNESIFDILRTYSDKRTEKWPFMGSIYPIFWILITYIFVVKVAGPFYMQNRKPYDLKRIIQCYNLFQVFSCTFIIYGISKTGNYGVGCVLMDYSDEPNAVKVAEMMWWGMIVKMCELIETVFFILRKKFNQVSNLHIYHHISTLLLTWGSVTLMAGGMATLPLIVNSFIHVIMYIYYFLTTLGPQWQKTLNKWKSKLTVMQMLQFAVLVPYSMQALTSDCEVPAIAAVIFAPNLVFLLYMFYDFYKKAYKKNK